jgi:hypothetical protein
MMVHFGVRSNSSQPTLEDLQPLYQAIVHGCHAGIQQEAWENIYCDRILRGEDQYSFKKLGAFGSNLAAIACFYETAWSRVSPTLSEISHAGLLAVAAYGLQGLGRLNEAVEPVRAGLELDIKHQNFDGVANQSKNLSELELMLGQVNRALETAALSVSLFI